MLDAKAHASDRAGTILIALCLLAVAVRLAYLGLAATPLQYLLTL